MMNPQFQILLSVALVGGCILIFLDKRAILNYTVESDSAGEINIDSKISENSTEYLSWERDRFLSNLLLQSELVPKQAPWYIPPPNKQDQINNLTERIRQELITPARKKTAPRSLLLYVIENGTLLAIQDQVDTFARYDADWYSDRWKNFEEMLQLSVDFAHQISSRNDKDTVELNTMINKMLNHSVPFIFDGSDWLPCARYLESKQVERLKFPYFTFAMSSKPSDECTPFAVPCFEMWQRFKRTHILVPKDWTLPRPAQEWAMHMQNNFTSYPWGNKIPKVVWRGSSTGVYSKWQDMPRFQLVLKGKEHEDTMDFAINRLNEGWENPERAKPILDALGDKVGNQMEFADFMKYKGILDLEGNSWSSRLGHLLCFNSVVLRVDRNLLNYFESELQPWVHYIPVKKDLSDLEEMAAFVADSKNDEVLQNMVRVSNEWCRSKMTLTQFAIDLLHVVLSYVEFIREVDEGWFNQWRNITQHRKWVPIVKNVLFKDGEIKL